MKTTFQDSKGRSWDLALNVGKIELVNDRHGVNLADGDFKALLAIEDDALKCFHVVACLCEKQQEAAGVSAEDFGESFDGAAYESAVEALRNAVQNFTPPRRRSLMQSLTAAQDKATARQIERLKAEVENPELMQQLEDATAKRIREQLRQAISSSVGNGPESSE